MAPPKKQAKEELNLPEKITAAWLFKHVPMSFWLWFGGAILTVFLLGIPLGQTTFIQELIGKEHKPPTDSPVIISNGRDFQIKSLADSVKELAKTINPLKEQVAEEKRKAQQLINSKNLMAEEIIILKKKNKELADSIRSLLNPPDFINTQVTIGRSVKIHQPKLFVSYRQSRNDSSGSFTLSCTYNCFQLNARYVNEINFDLTVGTPYEFNHDNIKYSFIYIGTLKGNHQIAEIEICKVPCSQR